ncbi:hypothetical protein WG70_02290 [Burkholderia oklahomensis EO147]|nr:hypothetical protein WG70_02290 [Burkholderia oklahomensis EO147]KUY48312.1 hypothetical protein WG70_01365 [Burkholderia oklahomensis EO147]
MPSRIFGERFESTGERIAPAASFPAGPRRRLIGSEPLPCRVLRATGPRRSSSRAPFGRRAH